VRPDRLRLILDTSAFRVTESGRLVPVQKIVASTGKDMLRRIDDVAEGHLMQRDRVQWVTGTACTQFVLSCSSSASGDRTFILGGASDLHMPSCHRTWGMADRICARGE